MLFLDEHKLSCFGEKINSSSRNQLSFSGHSASITPSGRPFTLYMENAAFFVTQRLGKIVQVKSPELPLKTNGTSEISPARSFLLLSWSRVSRRTQVQPFEHSLLRCETSEG